MLERKLDIRLNLEHNLTKLRAKVWIKDIPDQYNREVFTLWFEDLILASRCNNLFDEIRNLKNFLTPQRVNHADFIKGISTLIEWSEKFLAKQEKWSVYLATRQMEEVGMDFSKSPALIRYLQTHFDTMCEYDDLIESLNPAEKDIFYKLIDATDFKSSGEELTAILLNSLGLAWIDHLESRSPELRMVSSGKLEQLERDLQENIALKASLSEELVLLRARERATYNLEYNRLNNLTTYRDLHHEAGKKKKIWPLRKLIGTFHDELFKVMPIWLASPESVSALFPLQEIFDIVIFDEASQCFAERGIPAMARAKQVIVAGDQKQLKPGDFFQSRWEEDGESADTEVESLLDLASRHWLTLTLQGHYRSQAPELVEFSNRNFYNGRLELLPHRDIVNSKLPALEYIKVDGAWENQTNEAEAFKVANLVLNLTTQHPEKEIGVITFNQSQQMLVWDKVEDIFLNEGKAIPATLMVKNIENVQGDEKDIILFSIAYAPDAKGKMAMQFGSLNASGGENRLNVAITRAREKVIVVASILPDQLHMQGIKNNGPKLLKEYLRFAYGVSEHKRPMNRSETTRDFKWHLKFKMEVDESKVLFDYFPNADIITKGQNGFGSIILTDDDYYERALSTKHHHAILPKLLEDKRWKHHAVYSRNFWRDREKFMMEIQRIQEQS
jgi:hypothetical protein